jgi:hypothetical protein
MFSIDANYVNLRVVYVWHLLVISVIKYVRLLVG